MAQVLHQMWVWDKFSLKRIVSLRTLRFTSSGHSDFVLFDNILRHNSTKAFLELRNEDIHYCIIPCWPRETFWLTMGKKCSYLFKKFILTLFCASSQDNDKGKRLMNEALVASYSYNNEFFLYLYYCHLKLPMRLGSWLPRWSPVSEIQRGRSGARAMRQKYYLEAVARSLQDSCPGQARYLL